MLKLIFFVQFILQKLNRILDTIKDDNLKVMLAFGIGLHHAGLQESDRKTVEELFEHQHLQVTSLLFSQLHFYFRLMNLHIN